MTTSALHDRLDVVAATIGNLDYALQQLPAAEQLPVQTTADALFALSRVLEVGPLVTKLFKLRATLLGNFNIFRSPIYKLPLETLGEIFRYVCRSDSEGAMESTKIGAVCSLWRQAAWSDPQLWTKLDVGRNVWDSSHAAKLLELYHGNMGGLHYEITIFMPLEEDYKGPRGIPFEDVFEQIFIKHPDRLKTLIFDGNPKFWVPHIDRITGCGRSLPNLESLVIGNGGFLDTLGSNYLTAFCKTPCLTKLVLEDVQPAPAFTWARLTELRLHGMSSELALNIALQCENLVTLKLEGLLESSGGVPVALPREPTILRNLQTLECKSAHLSAHWERALISCLWFTTSLKRLVWLTKSGTGGLRREFLMHLPTSITELLIDCCAERDDIQSLKEVFARLTSLRTITLYLNGPLDLGIMKLFAVTDEYCLLPSLNWIEFMMMRLDYDEQQISYCVGVIESRSAMWKEKDMFDRFVNFEFVQGSSVDLWPE